MNQEVFIDVTRIEPRLKHPTIFNSFDALNGGETVVIHNDHDPKPLYYQLLGERGNCFTWTYLANGPEVWEVAIKKNVVAHMETVGEIAGKDLRKAEIFKKKGIDFCCGGRKSLEDACAEKGIDIINLKQELEAVENSITDTPQYDFNSWSPSFLIDYIINIHHSYTLESITALKDISTSVAAHHGKSHSELYQVKDKIEELACELSTHLKKEESILFPYIKQLEADRTLRKATAKPAFETVQNPVFIMERDHEIVGELLTDIRKLTKEYSVPADACNSYKMLYNKMQELENDLQVHIHLENNILFPKAIALEK